MSKNPIRTILCLLLISVSIAARQLSPPPVQAQTSTGTIAYVRAGGTDGDQIRLIEPDGSNDRALWTVPVPDPQGRLEILSLAWRPDATELAFSSNHEDVCSIFASDIYSIHPDGSNFRRVGNGPACHELSQFPKGNVTVTVRNYTSKFSTTFHVYVQGAPGVIEVVIPYKDRKSVV